MATLEGRSVASSYKDLLQVSNSNSGIDSTSRLVSDGEGTNSILYLSTGRVGIGKSPQTKFEVNLDTNKNLNFSASYMGSIAGILGRNDANDAMADLGLGGSTIRFSVDGTNDAMRLDSTGLGIGVSDPDSELEIFHTTDPQIKLSINTHGDAGIILGDADGVKIFGKGASNEVRLYSGASTLALRIDANSEISLSNNDAGLANTVFGFDAGKSIVAGADKNAFFGAYVADATLASGAQFNAGFGYGALSGLTSGSYNTALGSASMLTATTATNNVCIGNQSNPSANDSTNQIVIGQGATGVADNSVTLGNASVTDVYMAQDSGATVHADYVLSQGNQNHVANTMSSPYYRFDGVDDYIQILSNGTGTFDTQKFSIEALVYMDGTSDYYQIWSYDFTSHSTPYYAQHLRVNTSSNTLILAWNNGAGNQSIEIANAVEFNKWQHIVATFENINQKLYVNGSLVGSSATTATITYYAQEVWIGKANFAGSEFAGEMQKVRFFNNVLDATEVKELYSGISVPFKYKGANQTNILTGIHDDFDTNSTNHFAFQSNYSQYQATGFTGSGGAISVVNNVMAMTGIASGHGINGSGLVTKGKKYRMTFNVTAITGNWYLDYYNQSESAFSGTGLKIVEWTAGGSDLNMFSAGSGGALTIDASSIVMELVPIGAVAEYDGSGIASDKWNDKSGNDLHGTVSGATVENAPSGDDGLLYEEGTWNAGITFSSGSATLSTSFDTGKYIRIGNVVHVQGFFALASISSPSGDTFITGLPFTNPDHTEGQEFSAVSIRMTDLASALNGSPQGFVSSNATTIFLEKFQEDGTNAGTSRELGTHISATTTILLSATYQI